MSTRRGDDTLYPAGSMTLRRVTGHRSRPI